MNEGIPTANTTSFEDGGVGGTGGAGTSGTGDKEQWQVMEEKEEIWGRHPR